MNPNLYGGRKFIIALLAILCTTLLVAYAKITDGVYSTVLIATIGAYIAGNVTQKSKEATKVEETTVAQPVVTPSLEVTQVPYPTITGQQ